MREQTFKIVARTAFIMFCIVYLAGLATAATRMNITPSSQTVSPGEEFTLEIDINPDTPIAGVQFNLTYDNELITVINIEEDNFFASADSAIMFNPGSINKSSGTVSRISSSVVKGNSITE
jgi:hypothetical protein